MMIVWNRNGCYARITDITSAGSRRFAVSFFLRVISVRNVRPPRVGRARYRRAGGCRNGRVELAVAQERKGRTRAARRTGVGGERASRTMCSERPLPG